MFGPFHFDWRDIRRRGGLWLLLLAALTVYPQAARAACGDHLIAGRRSAADRAVVIPWKMSRHSTGAPKEFPACTGPSCHRETPVPVMPSSLIGKSIANDAIPTSSVPFAFVAEGSVQLASAAEFACGPAKCIFRPPIAPSND